MRSLKLTIPLLVLLFALVASTPDATAQGGSGYDLTWFTIDGGGYTYSSGGAFRLNGTLGQPDAGALNGGAYALKGGFWGEASSLARLFLPLLVR